MLDLKTVKSGDIVWWIDRNVSDKYKIHMGVLDYVDDWNRVHIDKLVPKVECIVHDPHWGTIFLEDIPRTEKRFKLPKDFNWDTSMWNIEYNRVNIERNPNETQWEYYIRCFEKGELIKAQDSFYDLYNIYIDISKEGYRYVIESKNYSPRAHEYINKVFSIYEEAQAYANEQNTEILRQCNLSDYDWSLEQIENRIGMWSKMYGKSATEAQIALFKAIDGKVDIEDVDIRIFNRNLEWKHWKNKRWNKLEV